MSGHLESPGKDTTHMLRESYEIQGELLKTIQDLSEGIRKGRNMSAEMVGQGSRRYLCMSTGSTVGGLTGFGFSRTYP